MDKKIKDLADQIDANVAELLSITQSIPNAKVGLVVLITENDALAYMGGNIKAGGDFFRQVAIYLEREPVSEHRHLIQ